MLLDAACNHELWLTGGRLLLRSIRQYLHAQVLSEVFPQLLERKGKKDYTLWRQCNEKPRMVPGCPGDKWYQGSIGC